ncbi:unnamed protein product [Sphenostylis stenocarpa]|uniref:Uncharacterized protein n=1 Tax=Sphenostylis stenocarpa TaxID=92480 RepID=A0AA86SBT4_9FABA|nr:unnamed protein product [Sphenostylis stenocarpa]
MNGKVAHREVRLGPQIAFAVGLPKLEGLEMGMVVVVARRFGGVIVGGSWWPFSGVAAGVVLAVVGGDCQGASGAIRLKGKRVSEGARRVGAATRGKRGILEEWK